MKKLFALLIMLIALIAIPQAYAKDAAGTGKSCAKAERSCADCAKTCDSALSYMQKKGGKYTAGKNQQIILDCIAMCKASANLRSLPRRGTLFCPPNLPIDFIYSIKAFFFIYLTFSVCSMPPVMRSL